MIKPPFTTDQFVEMASKLSVLPENERKETPRVRASGIASCARQQAYNRLGVKPTNEADGTARLTTEQGRIMEELAEKVLEAGGITLVDRQIELPEDYPVSGHPDGYLGEYDGAKWGFEMKHFGLWSYMDIFKKGLFAARPDIVQQVLLYGDALDWDYCLVLILAQDASATRSQHTSSLRTYTNTKNAGTRQNNSWVLREDWNPKVQTFTIPIKEYENVIDGLRYRAEQLNGADDGDTVVPEFNPETDNFPCNYCDFKDRCVTAGPGWFSVLPPPLGTS